MRVPRRRLHEQQGGPPDPRPGGAWTKRVWTAVYRFLGRDGRFSGDLFALRDEPSPAGEAEMLLQTGHGPRVARAAKTPKVKKR
ncbi:MAG: hypothetical protein HYV92_09655 [Candidatus Rokubacteria bacterium]|nr:hypothetical protein [Candidatus Rokubacteria bacterium]MBI2554661.1 hypothetical protein [Candidatus Rokubacteria bacterium]